MRWVWVQSIHSICILAFDSEPIIVIWRLLNKFPILPICRGNSICLGNEVWSQFRRNRYPIELYNVLIEDPNSCGYPFRHESLKKMWRKKIWNANFRFNVRGNIELRSKVFLFKFIFLWTSKIKWLVVFVIYMYIYYMYLNLN